MGNSYMIIYRGVSAIIHGRLELGENVCSARAPDCLKRLELWRRLYWLVVEGLNYNSRHKHTGEYFYLVTIPPVKYFS